MKKILPERDPQSSYEELLEQAMELYEEPYNDEDGERDPELPSLRSVAETMDTTILRVRKLLITSKMFSTETSRWIQELVEDGLSMKDIMKETGLSQASIYSYIPYKGRAFNLDESSLNADRQKKGRERAKTISKLKNCLSPDYAGGLDDWREYLWAAVFLFAGYRFKTDAGLRFSYSIVKDEVTGMSGIIIGDKSFTRAEIEATIVGSSSDVRLNAIISRFGVGR